MKYARISASTLLVGLTGMLLCLEYAFEPIGGRITVSKSELSEGSTRLAKARLQGTDLGLSSFIRDQRMLSGRNPQRAGAWRLLAEALLERARTHAQNKGLAVGKPVFSDIPEAMAADLAEGLGAIERARALAAEDSELLRIEAELLTAQITGIGSAILLDGRISELIRKAMVLDPGNPRLQVAMGCRMLFAPPFLGHDPAAAKSYLLAAAASLSIDERPLLLAAMACHLLDQDDRALELLASAAQRNPHNRFVAAVVKRMEAGEQEPFARDLEQGR